MIRRCPEDVKFDRTLDLGCGFALTSLFIANETDAKHVYAFDLWVSATENYKRITAKEKQRLLRASGTCSATTEAKRRSARNSEMDLRPIFFAELYFFA